MMAFLEKLLGLTWLGDLADKINGSKTLIGAIALAVHMLNIVPTYFPEYGFAPEVAKHIQDALLWIGVLLPVGAAHKGAKLLVEKK